MNFQIEFPEEYIYRPNIQGQIVSILLFQEENSRPQIEGSQQNLTSMNTSECGDLPDIARIKVSQVTIRSKLNSHKNNQKYEKNALLSFSLGKCYR